MFYVALILAAFAFAIIVGPLIVPESKRAGLYAFPLVMASFALIAWVGFRVVRRGIVLSLGNPTPEERGPEP